MPLSHDVPKLSHESVCGCWHFYIFEIICELLQPLREVSQALPLGCPFFLSCFFVLGDLSRFPDISSSLREFAGFDELDDSCANDVEDEHALELDDNSGTTTGTKLCVLHRNVLPIFGRMWLFTTGPLKDVSVQFAELAW